MTGINPQRVAGLYEVAERLRLEVERQQESWRRSSLVRVSFDPDFVERITQLTDGLELLLQDVERAEELRSRPVEGREVAA